MQPHPGTHQHHLQHQPPHPSNVPTSLQQHLLQPPNVPTSLQQHLPHPPNVPSSFADATFSYNFLGQFTQSQPPFSHPAFPRPPFVDPQQQHPQQQHPSLHHQLHQQHPQKQQLSQQHPHPTGPNEHLYSLPPPFPPGSSSHHEPRSASPFGSFMYPPHQSHPGAHPPHLPNEQHRFPPPYASAAAAAAASDVDLLPSKDTAVDDETKNAVSEADVKHSVDASQDAEAPLGDATDEKALKSGANSPVDQPDMDPHPSSATQPGPAPHPSVAPQPSFKSPSAPLPGHQIQSSSADPHPNLPADHPLNLPPSAPTEASSSQQLPLAQHPLAATSSAPSTFQQHPQYQPPPQSHPRISSPVVSTPQHVVPTPQHAMSTQPVVSQPVVSTQTSDAQILTQFHHPLVKTEASSRLNLPPNGEYCSKLMK